jgi:predicted amidohydrolase
VSLVQICSNDDLDENLARARDGVAEACGRGAEWVALPENFAYMRREGSPYPCAQSPGGVIESALSSWAKEYGVWILGGSFPEVIPGSEKIYNTSTLFDPTGVEVARYRKIHLFDVDLSGDSNGRYRESKHFQAGEEVVVAATSFGNVGLSICYDLRFPELYRVHSSRGADFITVPSAFMPETGKDHWEPLLRARAIENQAFVIAPAQCGSHSSNRRSYGRSMIVDPWGIVLAQGGDEPSVIDAECDLRTIRKVRGSIPSLMHQKLVR